MEILGTTLRICVEDLESSVTFYENLTGSRALRFERGGVSVAAVGCFLLMSGPKAEIDVLRKVAATIAVADVEEAGMLLTAYELISLGEPVSRADIREFLSGNMCRCTGYHAIVDAVAAVIAANTSAERS